MIKKILKDQPTEDKPYVVENYPYGFRLRTTIRYWVETTNRGQRFVSQTLNPKTDQWNKPKKSTYSQILLVGLDEKSHVTYTSNSLYSTESSIKFKEKYEQYFNEYQKHEIKNIISMSKVYDKVEYKITTRKYRHKVTGEITTALPIMQMNDYYEIDENGEPVFDCINDEKEEKQKELNRRINQAAVIKASKKTSVDSAFKTFKRIK